MIRVFRNKQRVSSSRHPGNGRGPDNHPVKFSTLPGAGLVVSAAFALSIAGPGTARADNSLDGCWMDSQGEVIMEIRACGEERCGKVVWLQKPFGPDGQALRDFRNSDPELQSRLVCGMTVASGFKKQDDGTWKDGTVYVPDIGSSFSGYAEVLSPTAVKVTGYVLIPLFGESEVWTRVAAPAKVCEANPPSSTPPRVTGR